MKRYHLIHEESNVTPLTLSINHHAMNDPLMAKLLAGHNVGARTFCAYRGYDMKFYIDNDKWHATSRYIVNEVQKSDRLIKKVFKRSLSIGEQIKRDVQKYAHGGLSHLTHKKLSVLLRRVFGKSVTLCTLGYVPALSDFGTFYFSDLLQSIFQKHAATCVKYGSSPAAASILLSTSARPFPSDFARVELKKIVAKKGDLGIWLMRWYWLAYGHLGPGWTKASLKKELPGLIQVELSRRQLQRQQALWFKRLHLSPREERVVRAAQDFVFLKGYRQEILFGVYALLQQAATLAGKRTGIKRELLQFVSLPELLKFFADRKPVNVKELKVRQKFCLAVPRNLWELDIHTGAKARAYLKSHTVKEEKTLAADVLTGQVAYPGHVKGKVLIINSVADLDKVRGPFVLVSQQTSPELLPAMKQARAFVTDHGGITSHASIVAREMKKPCVIGTRAATKVLKDGDMVEVDAEKGIVKRI